MTQFRATEAAALLGVSDDTIRRWIDAGRLPAGRDSAGRWVLRGRDLAEFAREHASPPTVDSDVLSSSRNRMPGLVTHVVRDGDSIHSVAHTAYGDATLWRRIAEANGIDDPLSLPRGTVLSIPTLPG